MGVSQRYVLGVPRLDSDLPQFVGLSGPPGMSEQAGEGEHPTREHQERRRLRNELQVEDGDTRLKAGHGGRSEAVLRVPDDEGRYELDVARSGRRPLIGALEDEAAEGDPCRDGASRPGESPYRGVEEGRRERVDRGSAEGRPSEGSADGRERLLPDAEGGLIAGNDASDGVVANLLRDDSAGRAGSASAALGGVA
jgi:hypothetical protein